LNSALFPGGGSQGGHPVRAPQRGTAGLVIGGRGHEHASDCAHEERDLEGVADDGSGAHVDGPESHSISAATEFPTKTLTHGWPRVRARAARAPRSSPTLPWPALRLASRA